MLAAALIALTVAGCSTDPSALDPSSATPLNTVPLPSALPTVAEKKIDTAATLDLLVDAYDFGSYISSIDSGYAHAGQTAEAFPRGSRVMVIRLALDGFVPFGEVDVSGVSLANSRWEDSPELAVVDSNEGPKFARDAGVPWLPAGAFDDTSLWTLPNHKIVNFVVAFYVPPAGYVLDLQLDVPSQKVPLILHIPLVGD